MRDDTQSLRLALCDVRTGERLEVCIDIADPSMPRYDDRLVDAFRDAPAGFGPGFDEACRVMHERQGRKDVIRAAAQQLAAQLIDYLEDSEGWNGERRRDRIREITRGRG